MSKDYSNILKNLRINRALKIALIGVLLVFIFVKSQKEIEDFFFLMITKGESFETKTLEKYYASFKPFRDWEIEDLEIEAKAAISIETENGSKKILFKKKSKEILPIASLTKLMTALISLENYSLDQKVKISKEAAQKEGISGYLKIGETFYLKDLLYSLLMESSNGAATALSEIMGQEKFVKLMNVKAKELGLEDTYFFNPTGLDPEAPGIPPNYSTAEDLVTLTLYLLKEPLIWEISKTREFELYETTGIFHHKVKNNNEFLEPPTRVWWGARVLGGKTGQTFQASECLLIILEGPRSGFLINIVLGSQNRFEEMKKMIDWIYTAYRW